MKKKLWLKHSIKYVEEKYFLHNQTIKNSDDYYYAADMINLSEKQNYYENFR